MLWHFCSSSKLSAVEINETFTIENICAMFYVCSFQTFFGNEVQWEMLLSLI